MLFCVGYVVEEACFRCFNSALGKNTQTHKWQDCANAALMATDALTHKEEWRPVFMLSTLLFYTNANNTSNTVAVNNNKIAKQ